MNRKASPKPAFKASRVVSINHEIQEVRGVHGSQSKIFNQRKEQRGGGTWCLSENTQESRTLLLQPSGLTKPYLNSKKSSPQSVLAKEHALRHSDTD